MEEKLKIQIQDFRKQYRNYYNYLKDSNWIDAVDIAEIYKTESDILGNVIRDIKNFISENEESLHHRSVRSFFNLVNKIINLHISRIDEYINNNNWTETFKEAREEISKRLYELKKEESEENKEIIREFEDRLSEIELNKRREISFQNSLFTQKTKVRVEALNLNINSDVAPKSPHLFHANRKASLIMRGLLYEKNSVLREKTDQLGINWESPNPMTSSELYINMDPKDIPPYDESKHFFEQEKSTIEFWEQERLKIINGVNIGGYQMSGFVYTGINFCSIPQGSGISKREAPVLLTDNIYYIDESLREAIEKDREGILFYGTRRGSKSVAESMYLTHGLLSIPSCDSVLVGFSGEDLGHVGSYLNTTFTNLPHALSPNIIINSDTDFTIGMKGKSAQDNYIMSELKIVNLDSGQKKTSTQKLAGFTPDRIVFDEALNEDEPVITENGYVRIADIQVGDEIYDHSGKLTEVIDKIDVGSKQLYKIEFYNGVSIEACGDHLWAVYNKDGKYEILSTASLRGEMSKAGEFSIPITKPVDFLHKDLPSDPYLFGLSFNHKGSSKTKHGYNYKGIPEEYIFSSIEQRFDLLRGLVDSIRHLDTSSSESVIFETSSYKFYISLVELATSLGILTTLEKSHINSKTSEYWRVEIKESVDFFRVGNKFISLEKLINRYYTSIKIKSINPTRVNQAYCIKVSNNDKLFLTKSFIVTHNCSKGNIIKPWLALRPALSGGEDGKRRTVAFLAATSGEAALSVHAEKMLRDPESFGILPMNYDLLESFVDPEHVTWSRNKFTTFMPAQMSLEGKKVQSDLSEFLKIDNEELKKVSILTTDWETSTEVFKKRRESAKDYEAMVSEISSFPLDTEDVYLSGDKNKFNVLGLKSHKSHLIEKELTGKTVRMHQNADGFIEVSLTNDPIIDTHPYQGGVHDAPVIIYQEPEDDPPFGLYVMGLDDVKHDTSDGTSVISATIIKRGFMMDEWGDRIVCTLATRPEKKEEAYKTMYCMMKKYNAIVFPEAEDEGFKDFLERRHRMDAIKHLAEGVDLSRSLDLDASRHRQIGYPATTKNVNRLNARVLAYTEEDVPSGQVVLDGYTRIPDIMLLEEMIQDKKGRNADRIRSFGLALIYCEFLDKNNMYIPRYRRDNRPQEVRNKPKVRMNRGHGTSVFTGIKKGF